jgi:hypothetical protein
VAAYFQQHFVATYQQVGSFQVVDEHGQLKKNGGNVASYFCTPAGRVIHAVTGPVNASVLLDEAHWAVENYVNAKHKSDREEDIAKQLAVAHGLTFASNNGQIRQIHKLLAENQMPPIQSVFQTVFQKVLGEKVSLPSRGIEAVVDAVNSAKEKKLPILFVLSKDKSKQSPLQDWKDFVAQNHKRGDSTMDQLADSYVVVGLPLDLMPAVSGRLGIRPFAAQDQSSQLLVVTRSDGRQLTSVSGWNNADSIKQMLAMGLIQEAKEHSRSNAQLKQLLPLAGKIDGSLRDDVKRLIKPEPRLRPESKSIAAIDGAPKVLAP